MKSPDCLVLPPEDIPSVQSKIVMSFTDSCLQVHKGNTDHVPDVYRSEVCGQIYLENDQEHMFMERETKWNILMTKGC